MQPSAHEVFYTGAWTQTSPPLFLVLERWVAGFVSHSEVALRIVPVVASLAGLLVAALAFGRWLSTMAALLSFTMLCGNYYLIKYSQQMKQYGTDFLVSAVLLLLVGRYLECRSKKYFVAVLAAGTIGLFLSYTAAFWLVSLFLLAALPASPASSKPQKLSRLPWARMAIAGCVLGSAEAVAYLVFGRPNRSADLVESLKFDYLNLHQPLFSLQRLLSSIGVLLAATPGIVSIAVGVCTAALAIFAVAWAVSGPRLGQQPSVMIVLSGALPPACAIAASALGLYAVLNYPRMLLFALPGLALLLGYGIDVFLALPAFSAHQAGLHVSVVGICIAMVLANQVILLRYPRPTEENRQALTFLQSSLDPEDLLFVHGGMYEQFKYYRTVLSFQPHLYLGNLQWPCCASGDRKEATSPLIRSFEADLLEAAHRAGEHRLWLLFPAASEGHWSGSYRDKIEAIPTILTGGGCKQEVRRLFGQTLVESYSCR